MNATTTIWPFGELIPLRYGLILADPPWRFDNWSKKGEWKNAMRHYPCMSRAELRALPVGQLAAPDCLFIMWATWPKLVEAMELLEHWGFTYKSGGCWSKLSRGGGKPAFGGGYIMRSASEPFLVATIGTPKRVSKSVRNLIVAPIREHSRKPDEMRVIARELCPDVAACELFAREPWPGADVWGNEINKWSGTHTHDDTSERIVLD